MALNDTNFKGLIHIDMKFIRLDLKDTWPRMISAPYLLCCSDCESFSVRELLELEGEAEKQLLSLKLGYTESFGDPLGQKVQFLSNWVRQEKYAGVS